MLQRFIRMRSTANVLQIVGHADDGTTTNASVLWAGD